jgi:quercetin dioxygenase-like cupin family protein
LPVRRIKVARKIAEEEVSPGLFIERRTVLTGIGGMILGMIPAARVFAAAGDDVPGSISFEQFLAQANPIAKDLVGDVSSGGQDRYLRSVAAMASNMHGVPVPEKWNFSDQGSLPESYAIGFNPGGESFRVLHWRLEPGASCRAHAHTYGNVVTIGLDGVARVRNFEVVGEPDYTFGGTFQVRQTVDQLLNPGSVNLVSIHRNYIHEITAGPDGARGLDITTPLMPRPDFGTPYLSMGRSLPDALGKAFEASWNFE